MASIEARYGLMTLDKDTWSLLCSALSCKSTNSANRRDFILRSARSDDIKNRSRVSWLKTILGQY